MARYFRDNERPNLTAHFPDHMWLISKEESTGRQDRIEVAAYDGFRHKRLKLGPPKTRIARPN